MATEVQDLADRYNQLTLLQKRRFASMVKPGEITAEDVLAILRDAASRGERCPTNPEIRTILGELPSHLIPSELAYDGHCVVEVYGKNWRVVEIDGKRTMACPHSQYCYRRIEKRDE